MEAGRPPWYSHRRPKAASNPFRDSGVDALCASFIMFTFATLKYLRKVKFISASVFYPVKPVECYSFSDQTYSMVKFPAMDASWARFPAEKAEAETSLKPPVNWLLASLGAKVQAFAYSHSFVSLAALKATD
jgi:hypothetical protein